jgi:phosphomannomutase
MSAALWFADLIAYLRGRGRGIEDRLATLYRDHGLWVSTQRSVVRPGTEGAAEIAAAMDLLCERRPDALGGLEVDAVTDFREGAGDRPRWLPEQALVEFRLGDAGRVLVRPSGTEPKLKVYVDLRAALPSGIDVWEAEAALLPKARRAAEDLVEFLGF